MGPVLQVGKRLGIRILRGRLPRGRQRCLAQHIHWREETAKPAMVAQKRGQQERCSELDREDAVCFEFAILGLRVMHDAWKAASSGEMNVHASEDSTGGQRMRQNQAGRRQTNRHGPAFLAEGACTTQGGQRVGLDKVSRMREVNCPQVDAYLFPTCGTGAARAAWAATEQIWPDASTNQWRSGTYQENNHVFLHDFPRPLNPAGGLLCRARDGIGPTWIAPDHHGEASKTFLASTSIIAVSLDVDNTARFLIDTPFRGAMRAF
jgi:hypothetical protein